ncbi:MAG: hypothetical protein ACFFB0_09915 [Promethearchaeota archaeon]
MSEMRCFYHPDIEAVSKCEQCGKLLCLQCKKVYHDVRRSGVGESSSSYAVTRELCYECYELLKQRKAIGKIIGLIIFIPVAIIIITVLIMNSFP